MKSLSGTTRSLLFLWLGSLMAMPLTVHAWLLLKLPWHKSVSLWWCVACGVMFGASAIGDWVHSGGREGKGEE